MKLRRAIYASLVVLVVLAIAVYIIPGHDGQNPLGMRASVEWQRMASPGDLSQPHAFLSHNCAACHTPVEGATPANCIVCHANDEEILQREPTAFHSDVSSCKKCHSEHQGPAARITEMDHKALTTIGFLQLASSGELDEENAATLAKLEHWLDQGSSDYPNSLVNPHLEDRELVLNCTACHQNDDRHFSLFGNDCAACHQTERWTIPEFLHPSPSSMDCAQCHQAPPSHYMQHFNMISAKVAGQPHARVDQCFVCHQTTSWNDIKRVGWYKHH